MTGRAHPPQGTRAPAVPILGMSNPIMKRSTGALLATVLAAPGLAAAEPASAAGGRPALRMPWREGGWSEREAVAHLLDRFAYGARPGEVERVAATGLDHWMELQLAPAGPPERALDRRLARLDALDMSAAEMARRFPGPPRVVREAVEAGVVERPVDGEAMAEEERAATRAAVVRWARGRGYRPQRELIGQLTAQKLYRAVYAERQLAEVLADFWFNHFNVSLTDRRARAYVLAYERDAIRPHVLGRFRDLLGATARHPAMLVYLDNAQSSAAQGAATTADRAVERLPAARRRPREPERAPVVRIGPGGLVRELPEAPPAAPGGEAGEGMNGGAAGAVVGETAEEDAARRRRPRGLNENYARELLELHTLGVDGGYSQQDVVEVARAFTGWTLVPPGADRRLAQQRLARLERAGGLGFATDGEFLFRADLHDAGAKTILGRRFPAGGGVEEGEEVLDLLARHPATARHVARKLAVRFVADDPPAALVERLAGVFQATGGDLRQVVRAVAESPEFWRREARAAKVKSPFELAVSALRALGAQVSDPRGVLAWTARMGQRLYAYAAPTGYPDRAGAWVNTGSLLERMNFGLALAAGEVPGVRFDLAAARARLAPDPSAPPERALGVFLGSPEFQRR